MASITTNHKLRVLLAFTGIYIIWGTTFLAISYGLKGFPPFVLSGFRFLVAGVLILLWLYRKGERPNSIANWKKNAIPGILILAAGVGLVAWGEQYVTSTEAAIVMASEPFWFIVLDKKNWKAYFSNPFIGGGLLIGFAGLVLFLKDSLGTVEASGDSNIRVIAFSLLVVSSILWVLGSLYSKKRPSSQSLFMNVAQQLTIGGLASLIIASVRGEWQVIQWNLIPTDAWLGLFYLIIFGSVMAYLSFIWLLSIKPPALVSTHTYVNPVVAVLFGWFMANEGISKNQFTGLFIILIGVLFTNMAHYKVSKRKRVRFRKLERTLNRLAHPYKHITHL